MPGRHRAGRQSDKVLASKDFYDVRTIRKPAPAKKVFPKGKKLTPSDTDTKMERP